MASMTAPDHESRSDAQLVEAGAQGDQAAFAALMNRHRSRMHAVCRRITCHQQDAEEALQNSMLQVWTKLGTFDGRSSTATWLYRIATNASIDEVRRRRRAPEPVEAMPDRATPADSGRAATARVDVERALSHLPPQYRAVVVLRELCDLTYAEIAELRELPLDTVKSQLSRGRQALAGLLADHRTVVA
jgi:RNA polymerase sigma-70 factor, ECF subfamily